jgi:hypothetical protein
MTSNLGDRTHQLRTCQAVGELQPILLGHGHMSDYHQVPYLSPQMIGHLCNQTFCLFAVRLQWR